MSFGRLYRLWCPNQEEFGSRASVSWVAGYAISKEKHTYYNITLRRLLVSIDLAVKLRFLDLWEVLVRPGEGCNLGFSVTSMGANGDCGVPEDANEVFS